MFFYQSLGLLLENFYKSNSQNIFGNLVIFIRPISFILALFYLNVDLWVGLLLESTVSVHSSVKSSFSIIKRHVSNIKLDINSIFAFFILKVLVGLIPFFILLISLILFDELKVNKIIFLICILFTLSISSIVCMFSIKYKDLNIYLSYFYYCLILVISKNNIIITPFLIFIPFFLLIVSYIIFKKYFYTNTENY